MNNTSSAIVQRLWNYCNVLRDGSMSDSDYFGPLPFLLCIKRNHANSSMPGKPGAIPPKFARTGRLRQEAMRAADVVYENHAI